MTAGDPRSRTRSCTQLLRPVSVCLARIGSPCMPQTPPLALHTVAVFSEATGGNTSAGITYDACMKSLSGHDSFGHAGLGAHNIAQSRRWSQDAFARTCEGRLGLWNEQLIWVDVSGSLHAIVHVAPASVHVCVMGTRLVPSESDSVHQAPTAHLVQANMPDQSMQGRARAVLGCMGFEKPLLRGKPRVRPPRASAVRTVRYRRATSSTLLPNSAPMARSTAAVLSQPAILRASATLLHTAAAMASWSPTSRPLPNECTSRSHNAQRHPSHAHAAWLRLIQSSARFRYSSAITQARSFWHRTADL